MSKENKPVESVESIQKILENTIASEDKAPVGVSEFLTREMEENGVYLEIVDLEEKFYGLPRPPLLTNDFNIKIKEEKERLNSLVYMSFDGDSLDPNSSCDCGYLHTEDKVDDLCPQCHTLCKPITEKELESILWIQVPDEVTAFINPQVYLILSDAMNDKIFNTLEYLTSPGYRCTAISQKKRKVEALGIPRDLNYFIENFDAIIDTLRDNKLLKDGDPHGHFATFIALNRDKLFTKYLPVPSRVNFITETTATGKYADLDMGLMLDGIQTINSIEHSVTPITKTVKINRTVKAMSLISGYYNEYYRKQLGKKTGWLRKHVFGASLHFSFRGVISSLSKVHDKETVRMPWSMSILAFKTHLTSLLLDRGYTPNQIATKLNGATLKYDPEIDELFKHLINTSGKYTRNFGLPGIPIILQRNPSLQRGSAQRLMITEIKTNPRDITIDMSVLTLKAPNADFDGDALNGLIALDSRIDAGIDRLAPHTGVMDTREPYEVSGNLAFPNPTVATLDNYFNMDI